MHADFLTLSQPITADITPTQFIMIDGRYKVNDFNRCRFMRVNTTDNSECGFKVGMNPGKVCTAKKTSLILVVCR